jgi:nitroimidazol reductase NimA-like FMN-containing flavoprotein (pyridoxamine 5'-phosphate oxidase superfamily)
MAESHELTADECLRLLKSGVFGRIALTVPTGPDIVPINYSVVNDLIVFRTTPYSVLGTYGRNAQMAFEVDHVDYEYGTGWSVVARGRGDAITDSRELDVITSSWTPRPWASGQRNAYYGLRWTELSGRRLGAVVDPSRDLAVERRTAWS